MDTFSALTEHRECVKRKYKIISEIIMVMLALVINGNDAITHL